MLGLLLTSLASATTPVYAAPTVVDAAVPSPVQGPLPAGCTIDLAAGPPPTARASEACGRWTERLEQAVLAAELVRAVPRDDPPLVVRFGRCPDHVTDSLCPVQALHIDQRRAPVPWPARARSAGDDRCLIEVVADDSGVRETPRLQLHRFVDCPSSLEPAARRAVRGWSVLGDGGVPGDRVQQVMLYGVAEVHLLGEPEDLLVPDRTGPAVVRRRRPVSPRGASHDTLCVVRVTIDTDGGPTAVGAVPGDCPEPLRAPAVEALTEWHWGPVIVDGRPVTSTFLTRVRFP